ncbi:hypothetical protein KZZ52_15165 [Dactylosporangium sp. AC04546]|uniref:hypothetical protein n=1 Tax=Dactylosporangium sp. AC04546 TaxID=2862460 RepID=UPI001EDEFAD4|nr:hypothetical protein [Dactylosporangium sp. AC04546]WVK86649.1 hypothetical protein KZZ52_15165 [Dactylosporangium sp. AC04546]
MNAPVHPTVFRDMGIGIAQRLLKDRSRLVVIMADALFVSAMQPSQHPTTREICTAAADELGKRGVAGCAAAVAGEFGDHPLEAIDRMRWALRVAADCRNGRRPRISRERDVEGVVT